MRLAVLAKQIPAVEDMLLTADGRLVREGVRLEMNAYCRRAVSKAVELAASGIDSSVTVLTLGPPTANDVLRESIIWGEARGVETKGVLISDPRLAGSDTLVTARALASALRITGPYDLILTGLNSLDSDTGLVAPQLAEILDLPFLANVTRLAIDGKTLEVTCDHDDLRLLCTLSLPALLSCGERLCEPAKVDLGMRSMADGVCTTQLDADDLGRGPWGLSGSPTRVGPTRVTRVKRLCQFDPEASVRNQAMRVVEVLNQRGALVDESTHSPEVVAKGSTGPGPVVAVIAEPGRAQLQRELLGCAAALARQLSGSTWLYAPPDGENLPFSKWGADRIVTLSGSTIEEDVARTVGDSLRRPPKPWAILVGSTLWGREVAARLSIRLNIGIVSDAGGLEVDDAGRLIAWKPVFGGQVIAAISSSSVTQLVTIRPGAMLPLSTSSLSPKCDSLYVNARGRIEITSALRTDDLETLARAQVIIGLGQGVDAADYPRLEALCTTLGAEFGATRKVTDKGWMPRSRQIGITGRSISPRLYIAIGISGKFNHVAGIQTAGTIVAINSDISAPIWNSADTGILGNWKEAVPVLVSELRRSGREKDS